MKKVALLIIFFLLSCNNDSKKSPNILFIMSDDHTSESWGIYGGILQDYVKNEGIKKLEKSGFIQGYVARLDHQKIGQDHI